MQADIINKYGTVLNIAVTVCGAGICILGATRKAGEALIDFSEAGVCILEKIQQVLETMPMAASMG